MGTLDKLNDRYGSGTLKVAHAFLLVETHSLSWQRLRILFLGQTLIVW